LFQRLEESRMRVLRTDREGAVRVLTDGRDLRVSCYVAYVELGELSGSLL
jgi:beta-lactamase superfamily II metal-dependent hydrolase